MRFFSAIFISTSELQYSVNHVGVEMKILTSIYTAIRSLLKVFRARKTASENLKDSQAAASPNSHTESHTEKSNRSDDIQGFSVNTLKTGDKKNNGD